MNKVKIWFEKADVADQLLKSKEIYSIVEGLANDIAGQAGEGYSVSMKVTKTRVRANISPKTPAAKADNERNNTLLRAMGK